MSFEFSQSPQAIWLYQYDVEGVYIGSVFMTIPAGTGLPVNTTHIPCEPDKGQTGIFKNGAWKYVDDIRGTRYWNIHGTGFVISALSESLPDWAITVEPPAPDAGCVLLFTDGQWTQVEDKTGQLYYESNGTKHVVSDAWFTLPEGCTFVAPPEDKPTFVTRWNGTEWIYLKDLRGQLAWNTETRESTTILEVGPVPDGYTLKMPGQFDEWDGSAWVKIQRPSGFILLLRLTVRRLSCCLRHLSKFHCSATPSAAVRLLTMKQCSWHAGRRIALPSAA